MLKRIESFLRSFFESKYKAKYSEDIPEVLKDQIVYIIGADIAWTIVFNCPCGCKKKIFLNLLAEASPKWSYKLNWKRAVSIYPSVNRICGCKSHFWLRDGKIYFVR